MANEKKLHEESLVMYSDFTKAYMDFLKKVTEIATPQDATNVAVYTMGVAAGTFVAGFLEDGESPQTFPAILTAGFLEGFQRASQAMDFEKEPPANTLPS